MNDGLVPQRYARALYKSAVSHGNAEKVYEEMSTAAESFAANPSLQKTLSNPFVSREDKEKLLLAAVGQDADNDYRSFVKLILDHNREDFAWRMALAYRKIYREANKISRVEIITANPLQQDQKDKILGLVEKSFPGRTFEFSEKVDPSLIGGFVIDVDSVRMDASISNEIEQLRQKLLSSN